MDNFKIANAPINVKPEGGGLGIGGDFDIFKRKLSKSPPLGKK